ncbi:MAG: helix-turn-helix domain-containing protein [Chloroflexota bacterium]
MSSHSIHYKAMKSRDKRFDGKFFVAVKTTGIYCRPICPAPSPKPENVKFYNTASGARKAGFRPCLRCHPESAPNSYEWDGSPILLSRAMRLISEGFLDYGSVQDLADTLNISPRHLRRLFTAHLGTNPIAVAQTRRLHLAKKLIHETSLPFSKISQSAGFPSLRAFNHIFKATFNKTPTQLRKRAVAKAQKHLTLYLAYRPPYAWSEILAHFRTRAIAGLELVTADAYHRLVSIQGTVGEIAIFHVPNKAALRLKVSTSLSPHLAEIVSRTRRMFDLEADPMAINSTLSPDPRLAGSVNKHPGMRVAGAWDEFELAMRAIIGQQISLKGAVTMLGRLTAKFGEPNQNIEHEQLTTLFPQPDDLADADLSNIGLTGRRITVIRAIAHDLITRGSWRTRYLDLDSAITALTAFSGIGPWTAHYIAMRTLDFPDAFPAGDLWLRQVYSDDAKNLISQKKLVQQVEKFRPWRAYAAAHIWASLK